jgi:glycosyltransferase involved in cell wall biosynthesis
MNPVFHNPRSVFHISYVYRHHATRSGYHRLSDFIGTRIELSPALRVAGETLLRLPGKLISWWGGHFEYSRHDFTMEVQTFLHMRRHRNALYHFLYGEKSFKLLAHCRGFHGHRFIATLHHPEEHYAWLFRSTRHLSRLDHAVVLSRQSIEFTERLVGRGRVSFIPYGVDTDYFQPAPQRDRRSAPRCVFVGYHMRDFDTLARVVSNVLEKRSEVEFWLVSGNPRCAPLAERPRVQWLKKIPDEDYLRVLQQSDLLVLPLHGSVANTAVLEAMAVGLPMVVTDGGVRDYVDSSCAVLTPQGDASSMTDAVLQMLSKPTALDNMRRAARRRALQFDWREIARQMADLYARWS